MAYNGNKIAQEALQKERSMCSCDLWGPWPAIVQQIEIERTLAQPQMSTYRCPANPRCWRAGWARREQQQRREHRNDAFPISKTNFRDDEFTRCPFICSMLVEMFIQFLALIAIIRVVCSFCCAPFWASSSHCVAWKNHLYAPDAAVYHALAARSAGTTWVNSDCVECRVDCVG